MNDPTKRGAYVVDSSAFEIDLQLRSKPLLGYLVAMVLFYSAFTITFYVGIPIKTVYEAMGTSTRSEALVLQYNTYSSYIMALIEVLIGMYMNKFVPVLEVYLHNALFFLMRDSEGKPRSTGSRRLHAALLCLLPVMITLTNSSVKGLQAVPFITGVKRVMTVEDMKKDQPALEKIKTKLTARSRLASASSQRTVSDTILKNAVRQQATPFTFDTNSSCGQRINNAPDGSFISDWKLNAHEIGGSSAIYGFIPREWNGEALTTEPIRTSTYTVTYQQAVEALRSNTSLPVPANFSIKTAYEMLVQGKMVIERAYGSSVVGSYNCSLSDDRKISAAPVQASPFATTDSNGNVVEVFKDNSTDQWLAGSKGSRQCEGGVSSMFKMGDYYSREVFKAEDLIKNAADIIGITIPFISKEETNITLDTYDLTPEIRLETMQIDLILNPSVNYGFQNASAKGFDPMYVYGSFQNTFCGSNNCAFVDTSGTFPIQPEIGVLPYYINCTLDQQRVHYSADYRTYFPDQCTRAANASFLYGYGSYMTGKEFGSNSDSLWGSSYIVAPRRRITFAFAKVVWTLQDLATTYNASCGRLNPNRTQIVNCTGLSYQLQPSGRFLFAGKDALPNDALRGTSFRSPIPLVQLNSPTFESDGVILATIERLAPENFNKTVWPRLDIYNGSSLGGNKCSMLVDSYLRHVNENHYFLERPLQAMYTSFFYFLMENAAVTQLNDTAQVLRHTGIMTAPPGTNDRLPNVRLKGDFQVRSIRLSMPLESYLTTLFGCVCIFIATVVIIFVPIRFVEYFPEGTTMAEQFMAMSFEEGYPSSVHDKLLKLPAPASTMRFEDVRIEALAIKHCPPGTIQSKAKEAASEASESESDVSQATISEEIA